MEFGLPPLTTSLAEAKEHLAEYGLARIENALDPGTLAAARQRVEEQAKAEAGTTLGITDGGPGGSPGGPNQWVHNRQQENFALSLAPEVHAQCSEELLKRLGFSVFRTLGGMSATRPMFGGVVPRPTEFVTELGKG